MNMDLVLFDSLASSVRTIVVGAAAYIGMVVLLRASGKRTLSKMNAFDFIVTVALGSTLATVMLNKNVALVDGLLAIFLLIFLQYVITWLSVRYKWFSSLVKSTPALLVYRGQMQHQVMRRERIAEDELLSAVREKGLNNLSEAGAIVLESNGSLTLVEQVSGLDAQALANLQQPGSKSQQTPMKG